MTTRTTRCGSPTTPRTASAAASGPPTASAARTWPAGSARAASRSTAPRMISRRRSAATRRAVSAASSAPPGSRSMSSSRRSPPSCDRSVVAHLLDADGDGQDQPVVLVGLDLDPVRVAHAQPALGDLGDLLAVALDLVLVVDDVALGRQIVSALDLDRVAVADPDERLLDGRHRSPAALDLHLVAHRELLLLDREQLVARAVLEHERVAHPERLAVDLEGALAAVGLDPVVVADREHLLAQGVARPLGATTVTQSSHHCLAIRRRISASSSLINSPARSRATWRIVPVNGNGGSYSAAGAPKSKPQLRPSSSKNSGVVCGKLFAPTSLPSM